MRSDPAHAAGLACDAVFTPMRKGLGWRGSYITEPFIRRLVSSVLHSIPKHADFHFLIALEDDHLHLEVRPSTSGGSASVAVNAPNRGRYPDEVVKKGKVVAAIATLEK